MNTDCIEWTGYRIKGGYGRRMIKGKCQLAHRVAYCAHHVIPIEAIKGVEVRHTCDHPPCVNPDHLVLGSHTDNMQDMVVRGRKARCDGLNNGNAKLSESQVQEIRQIYVKGSREFGTVALSKKYGVSQPHISKVVLAKAWRTIESTRRAEARTL